MSEFKRKLIEVALPLDAINKEAAREKSIRHGHPSTLHLWWARRPLAACRAVLFAQLVDDPSAHPEEFPTEEAQAEERERLFRIIEALVKWENSNNEEVLGAARAEIRRSCGGDPPPILDPFAGGGSIPLEAQRLGLEAHASDLNPVAVLINKALIEIPPRWAGQPPVHPREGKMAETWSGAQGLAEDVRYYGQWMRDEAERRIGHLYPKARLEDGSEAMVIAWLWARTVKCPNPACGATMPLVRSFWLSKKKGKETWVDPIVDGKTVRFEIGHGQVGPPIEGTVNRRGAVCIVCDSPVPFDHIRSEGRAGRMSEQLMAIVAEGNRSRLYLPPTKGNIEAADVQRPADVPETELPHNPRDFKTPNYGIRTFADLFTNRQLVALTTFTDLVGGASARVGRDARTGGQTDADCTDYARALSTYLALGASKAAAFHTTGARWRPDADKSAQAFGRQAIPMVWDYAEVNPFAGAGGDWIGIIDGIARVLEKVPARKATAGGAEQANAEELQVKEVVWTTDPPYYDNIGYADLSDFFYVWLRRSLRDEYPVLFSTLVTPKSEELVATPYRFGGSREEAQAFFEGGFRRVFDAALHSSTSVAPLALFYAFRESEDEDGPASAGWETMLEGLLQSGWTVTATWPLRTEMQQRLVGRATNSLASSIVLACRPRKQTAGVTDRRGFLSQLRNELPTELVLLQQGGVAPIDLPQAAVGPGMAVFSRYSRVVEPSGEAMRVRSALTIINDVLAGVLDEQEGDFDRDTRWAIKWFEQYGMDRRDSGEAIQLCRTYGTTLEGVERAGLAKAARGKTWLISRDELADDWDPATDKRPTIWEATQHLIRRLLVGGEQDAADLLRRLGGLGETAQLLAYRLYSICERKGWASEAGPYNALGGSWKEIQRLSRAQPATEQDQMTIGDR